MNISHVIKALELLNDWKLTFSNKNYFSKFYKLAQHYLRNDLILNTNEHIVT